MKIKKLLAVLLGISLAHGAWCQTAGEEVVIESKIRWECLQMVSIGLTNGAVLGRDDQQNYVELFTDSSVLVHNDIMPHNQVDEQVPIGEYLRLLPKYFEQEWVTEILPYNCQILTLDTEKHGFVEVNALKIVILQQPKGASLNAFYNDTFDIKVTIRFDYFKREYLITEIKSNKEMGKYLLLECGTKSAFSKRRLISDEIVLVDGKATTLDNKGRVVIKGIKANEDLFVEHPSNDLIGGGIIRTQDLLKIFNSDVVPLNNSMKVTFRKTNLYVQPQVFYGLSNFSLLTDRSITINGKDDYILGAGMTLGWRFISKPNYQLSIESGLCYDLWSYELGLVEGSESYMEKDPDGSEYERTVSWQHHNEAHEIELLMLPAYLNLGFRFSSWVPYLKVGMEVPIAFKGNYTSTGDFKYQGYYEDLFNQVVMKKGVYDFGEFNDVPGQGELNAWNMSYLLGLGIGLDYWLTKRSVLAMGLSYKKSLTPIYNGGTIRVISTDSSQLMSVADLNSKFYWQNTAAHLSYKFYF